MSIRPRRSLMNSELYRPSALNSKPRSNDMLWLDKNENLDPILLKLSHEVLRKIPPKILATYPEAGALYRKLAKWVGVSPESLLLTPGSDGAIRIVFESFVEHNDIVVHTNPTFAMYPVYSKMFGAKVIELHYEPTENGPQLKVDAIIEAIKTHKPKLFCLPNPDSPTGTVLSQTELSAILKVCESNKTILLIDEAYHPFYEQTVVPFTSSSRNMIVTRTFAKAWGIAGLRVGYAVAHPKTTELLHKMRPMYETSTLSIEFVYRMLDHVKDMEQAVTRINKSKIYFQKKLQNMGFKVLPTASNYLHVAFGDKGASIHDVLNDKVLYRPTFDQPCLKGYSRFTVGTQREMEQVVDLIKKVMVNTS